MFKDISIKLNPYLVRSKNLMEFFVIIGYEEKILLELGKNNNLEIESELEISVISSVVSDLAYGVFDSDIVIKQIYPDKPKIIKITKSDQQIPKMSSVIFYSCFDSLVGEKKILYSCYALRFYEKFMVSNTSYYIPKAFLIFSQYPYFTTFHNICLNTLRKIKENNNVFEESSDTEIKEIPIEILLHCLVNYIPSPVNKNLILKIFPNEGDIFIQKLTGYPYIDFNLCRIFNFIPIDEFIKIYLLTFLEIGLLFFSPDLLKLNISMFIFNILNYPLIDSNYYWHIKSISKSEMKFGDETLNPTFRGVNSAFNSSMDFSHFRNLSFIVDIDNKSNKIIKIGKDDIETKEINKLLNYFDKILSGGKVKSIFLHKSLTELKDKLTKIKKEYDKNAKNNDINDKLFTSSKIIISINKQIQEAFYDFILNILIILYKDYKLKADGTEIIKNFYSYKNIISEEENIFLKYYRQAIKYNTYFDLFICQFKAVDELKVSLIFSDEYVNVKIKDSKNEIPNRINYFKLMDKYYSFQKKDSITIDLKNLKEEFNKTYKQRSIKSYIRENESQLIELDKNLIKIFLFHKKSRGLFNSLKIKEKEEIIIDSIEKTSITTTLEAYFYPILNSEYFVRSSCVYIFSIIFPLFPPEKVRSFLKEILENINKAKFFQRYYIYILLKSIHKYYLVNQENGQFPELTFENIKDYCTIIKEYLINKSIIPNEEILLFLKKILSDDKLIIQNEKKGKNNNNKFIFIPDKKNYESISYEIFNGIVIKSGKNKLIFNYKEEKKVIEFFNDCPIILQIIYTMYDNYFNELNFSILNFESEGLSNIIINLIYYLTIFDEGNLSLSSFFVNTIGIFKKLENDKKLYKSNNINEPNNIINKNDENNKENNIINNEENDNKGENIVENDNKDNINDNKNNIIINNEENDNKNNIIRNNEKNDKNNMKENNNKHENEK